LKEDLVGNELARFLIKGEFQGLSEKECPSFGGNFQEGELEFCGIIFNISA